MMYGYRCECGHKWTVIKSVANIDRRERCPGCDGDGERYISRTNFYGASDWNSPDYQKINPAFGVRIRDREHKKELCRQHNVEEVGNDFKDGESMQKHYDTERQRMLDARWDDI